MSAKAPKQGRKQDLREGFTTGSAATAAAMAALHLLLSGEAAACMDIPLPPFGDGHTRKAVDSKVLEAMGHLNAADVLHALDGEVPAGFLRVPVEQAQRHDTHSATASVIKDGGDDPDATHGARIVATVWLEPLAPGHTANLNNAPWPPVRIEGGPGVGRVTLPGLPLPVGEAAINPVPRRQIAHGLRRLYRDRAEKLPPCTLRVRVSVPDGERLAKHTFNPRLGIVGGISILGTQGTVKPYSNAAWQATIRQGLDVAVATGCSTLCLSTGRRSEKSLLNIYPHVPPQAAVQVADFAEFSLREAGKLPIPELVWGCFFGKLVKLAQGHAYTHARSAELDFALLARWCAEAGAARSPAAEAAVESIAHCVTANHALELLLAQGEDVALCAAEAVARRAAAVAQDFAGRPVRLHLFHLNGQELVRL